MERLFKEQRTVYFNFLPLFLPPFAVLFTGKSLAIWENLRKFRGLGQETPPLPLKFGFRAKFI